MKRTAIVGAAVAALMSVNLYAQGRNFSGTWTIDSEKTAAANAGVAGGGGRGGAVVAGGGGTIERRVVDPAAAGAVAVGGGGRGGGGGTMVARSGAAATPAGTTIAIDTKSFTLTQGQTSTAYALDGSTQDVSNAMRKATAKASWQGDKLVIETTSEGQNGPVVTLASWYLEGESLVRENTSTAPDGQAMTRKTYFKKQ